MVAGLLIAAGILLVIGELLRLYVVIYNWQHMGVLGIGPLIGVLFGLAVGALTSYAGWRVGRVG